MPGGQLLQLGVHASGKMPAFSTNVAGQEGGTQDGDAGAIAFFSK